MEISRKVTTDVLIVGSGLSGIKAAKELAAMDRDVLMVTKTKLASGSSFYPLKASLGTQVTKNQEDQNLFLNDIEDLSRGMHNQDLAEVYVKEIPERVKEYEDIGVQAKKLDGERKACFANHARDIYLLSDWDQIRENVRAIFDQYDRLNVMSKTVVVSLIKKQGQIAGAILLDDKNEFVLVECRAVVLATGGFGSIYKHNLNPADVDGSGHVLALEAGASLVNMEFIQFIPGITTPRYKTLFGEHTLMYCQDIIDDHGESLITPYLPETVSKEECLEIRSTHGPFTHSLESKYFDIAMMENIIKTKNENGFTLAYSNDLYDNEEEFYKVYLDWLKTKNVHLTEQEIKIAPFAHASNGGVSIDENGGTGIAGLYAIGELSSNIEGANRLGGNSTGACMVFGKRSAIDCDHYLQAADSHAVSISEGEAHLARLSQSTDSNASSENDLTPNKMIDQIKEIMWYHGNVVRSEEQLKEALEQISDLESGFEFNKLIEHQQSRKLAIKGRNAIKMARLLLQAMQERKESRGAHYRKDYPAEDSSYDKRLFILKDKEKETLSYHFLND